MKAKIAKANTFKHPPITKFLCGFVDCKTKQVFFFYVTHNLNLFGE